MQRNRIIAALAATLALTACTSDPGERVTGPGQPAYERGSSIPRPAPLEDSTEVQAVEGGNAFGSGT